MSQTVQCPGCDLRLRYHDKLEGMAGVCPSCEHLILPPDENKEDRAAESLPDVKLADDRMDDLEREGKALARENDIRVNDQLPIDYRDSNQVDARVQDLKRDMPEKESAYQPSGKLPSSAMGLMVAGTGAAFLAAIATELVVGALAAVVLALIVGLNALVAAAGWIVCIAVVFGVIIGLIALAAPFFCGGWAAAWVITYFGKVGKNRNVHVAALLSMGVTAASVLVLWLFFVFFGANILVEANPGELGGSWLHWIGHGVAFIGGILAVLTAWGMASNFVAEAKFCEECEEFMIETELKSLRIGTVEGMTIALKEKNAPAAAAMLSADKGDDGKAMLYHCPCCHAGYIEVSLLFKAKWKDNDADQNRDETWRVASVPLDEYEVEWFRLFKARIGDETTGDEP